MQLSSHKGALSVVGDLVPTTAGKKENAGEGETNPCARRCWRGFTFFFPVSQKNAPDVKPVVVVLSDVQEFRLRGDASKFNNFYFWAKTARAWYVLKSAHADYADWWREQAAQTLLAPLVEREVASKNPRSFERIVARLCKELPGQKNEVTDFVDRFGAFVVKQFQSVQGSEFLAEMRSQVEARGAARASWPLPGNGERLREVNRDCNKGNEWACQLLNLPLPERVSLKGGGGGGDGEGGEGKKRSRKSDGGEAAGAASPNSAAVAKKTSRGVEDMSLPDAASQPKLQFKRFVCPIPDSHLLDLFTVTEFVGAFGSLVLGQDSILSPSELIAWLTARNVPNEYEIFLRDLMNFIGTEGLSGSFVSCLFSKIQKVAIRASGALERCSQRMTCWRRSWRSSLSSKEAVTRRHSLRPFLLWADCASWLLFWER